MTAATLSRDFLAPPRSERMAPGFVLALVAHLLLIAALAWSVRWHAADPEGVEAELWSALPQVAAPRAPVVEPPQPQPRVEPPPTPVEPKPQPVQRVEPKPPPPPREDPQIAIDRNKARVAAARKEEERQEALRRAEIEKREALKKAEAQKKAEAEQKRLADAEQKRDEQKLAAAREANLKRMMAQAGGAEASPNATGTAARTSGPSAAYAGRIAARIKPKIVWTGNVAGNPRTEVEVKLAPDGTIVGRRITKSSGSSEWDDAVLRAIDKTGELPRDLDGTVPSSIAIGFRPQDLQ